MDKKSCKEINKYINKTLIKPKTKKSLFKKIFSKFKKSNCKKCGSVDTYQEEFQVYGSIGAVEARSFNENLEEGFTDYLFKQIDKKI